MLRSDVNDIALMKKNTGAKIIVYYIEVLGSEKEMMKTM